jgi:hypothetical protein
MYFEMRCSINILWIALILKGRKDSISPDSRKAFPPNPLFYNAVNIPGEGSVEQKEGLKAVNWTNHGRELPWAREASVQTFS